MKYVFVIPDIDFLYLQYKDFEQFEDNNRRLVRINNRFRRFVKLFCKLGFHRIRIFNGFIKRKLKSEFCRAGVRADEKNCFILYSRTYEDFRCIIARYIKKEYSESKIIVYYGDLISRHLCSIEEVKKNVDFIYSFDEGDAKVNGVQWLLEPFSSSIAEMSEFSQKDNPIEWDVTFVGHAKNRYDKIIELYEKLVGYGLSCDFHITGVPEGERKHCSDIKYEALSFSELLKHVVKSRCVAEILQDSGVSPTTRYTEALVFKKNLLTDCKYFEVNENRSSNIIYIKNIQSIGEQVVKEIKEEHDFDRDEYLRRFSVSTMIDTIMNNLN